MKKNKKHKNINKQPFTQHNSKQNSLNYLFQLSSNRISESPNDKNFETSNKKIFHKPFLNFSPDFHFLSKNLIKTIKKPKKIKNNNNKNQINIKLNIKNEIINNEFLDKKNNNNSLIAEIYQKDKVINKLKNELKEIKFKINETKSIKKRINSAENLSKENNNNNNNNLTLKNFYLIQNHFNYHQNSSNKKNNINNNNNTNNINNNNKLYKNLILSNIKYITKPNSKNNTPKQNSDKKFNTLTNSYNNNNIRNKLTLLKTGNSEINSLENEKKSDNKKILVFHNNLNSNIIHSNCNSKFNYKISLDTIKKKKKNLSIIPQDKNYLNKNKQILINNLEQLKYKFSDFLDKYYKLCLNKNIIN